MISLGAALVLAAFMRGFLPGWVIAFNDDFAYLRSVVETMQHGRPWTNDFLEPWSFSLSALSAGLFKLTGSFTLATLGLQILLPAVSYFFAAQLVFDHTKSLSAALTLPALILTFPTVLWKQAEYTALVLYLPCLFAMLWCVSHRRWRGFLVVFAIAVASRQSAITWLVFPGVAAIEAVRRHSWREAVRPAVVTAVGLAWFVLVSGYANETHAQHFITRTILPTAKLTFVLPNLGLAAWVGAVGFGAVSLLLTFARRADPSPGSRRMIVARGTGVIVAIALLVSVRWVGKSVPIGYEHPFFDNPWAVTYLKALVVLAAAGWALSPPMITWGHTVAGLAAGIVASLRCGLWDYYLLDSVLFVIFGVIASTPAARPAAAAPRWLSAPLFGIGLALALLIIQLTGTAPLKRALDERAGACAVLEHALRAGWMKPTELSHAPFGFVGWHLFPYYVRHEGKNSADLGGFGMYIAQPAVDVHIDPADRGDGRHQTEIDAAHHFALVARHGWFGYARYSLFRRSDTNPPRVALNWSEYEHSPFPLNDAEWREVMHRQPAENAPSVHARD